MLYLYHLTINKEKKSIIIFANSFEIYLVLYQKEKKKNKAYLLKKNKIN